MPNRITAATSDIPIKDLTALRKQLTKTEFSAVEAAPAFVEAFDRSPNRAVALARGYAATLKTTEDHRQLFQVVAGLDDTHRRALIKGYREEGQGRGVVQAISLLPRSPGPGRHAVARAQGGRQGRQAGGQGGRRLAARRRRRDAGARHGPAQPGRRRRRGRVLRGRRRRDLGCRERGRRRAQRRSATPSSTPSPTSSTGPSRPCKDLAHALYAASATLAELVGKLAEADLPGAQDDAQRARADRHRDEEHRRGRPRARRSR